MPNEGMNTSLVPLIPEYSGAKGGTPLKKLLKVIDQYATLEGWKDSHKLAVLNAKCIGEAGSVLDNAPVTPKSYEDAVKLLKERFVPKLTVSRLISSLTEPKQRPDESVMRYVDRLTLLMNKAKGTYGTPVPSGDVKDPGEDPVGRLIEETLLATLQKGLRSERIKASLINSEPSSLAEARETLKKLEAREEEFFPNKKSVCAVQLQESDNSDESSSEESLKDQPKEKAKQEPSLTQVTALIQEAVTKLSEQSKFVNQQSSLPPRETRSCWTCGKMGHLARNCKQKVRNSQNSKIKCFNCGKIGHKKAECRSRPNSNNRQGNGSQFQKRNHLKAVDGPKNGKTPPPHSG